MRAELRRQGINPIRVKKKPKPLFGGAGSNRYTYLQNAPVFISGGTGLDTVVINGTPIGDLFIVTDK